MPLLSSNMTLGRTVAPIPWEGGLLTKSSVTEILFQSKGWKFLQGIGRLDLSTQKAGKKKAWPHPELGPFKGLWQRNAYFLGLEEDASGLMSCMSKFKAGT